VTTNTIIRQVATQVSQEPGAGGDGAVVVEPQFGVEREAVVVGSNIALKTGEGVIGGVHAAQQHPATFEETVSLVTQQVEVETVGVEVGGVLQYNLPVVLERHCIQPNQFAKLKQSMKGGSEDGAEKQTVVGGVQGVVGCDGGHLSARKWPLVDGVSCMHLLAACEGLDYKVVPMGHADVGVKRFELVVDAREVIVDRLGLDVLGYVDGEGTESVGCGLMGDVVEGAEGDVRLKGRGIGMEGATLNGAPNCNGMFMLEPGHGPSNPLGLLGLSSCRSQHCCPPSGS